MQVWQTFLTLAQVVQISVFLKRDPAPGFHRNTVKGRVQILRSEPSGRLAMQSYDR